MSDKKDREFVKFEGKCKWAKILPGQQETKYDPKPGEEHDLLYSISVECSEKKFKALKAKGLLKNYVLKEEEEGETYFNLKALKQKTGKDGAPHKILGDIKVIDKYRQPVTDQIGNGSDVIVIAELIDSSNKRFPGKIIRLLCVQVINHIVYEGKGNNIDEYEDLLEDEEAPEKIDVDDVTEGDDDESYL